MPCKPLLLDLYCGGGGAAMGYHRAGFDVVGIDHVPQPDYPFEFHQLDAIEALSQIVISQRVNRMKPGRTWPRHFDAVHASPPCQHYNALAHGTNGNPHAYPALIEPTRELLIETGLPYVIECPTKWPLRSPVRLCGEMFDLAVIRHRFFETNWPAVEPVHKRHRGRVAGMRHGEWFEGPYFQVYGDGGGKGSMAQWRAAMGIDWITMRKTMAEAIPPAYTWLLGKQLLEHITEREESRGVFINAVQRMRQIDPGTGQPAQPDPMDERGGVHPQ